jgi:anthranilate synthase
VSAQPTCSAGGPVGGVALGTVRGPRPGNGPTQWETGRWTTPAGITVVRTSSPAGPVADVRAQLEAALDARRGLLMYCGADRLVGYVDPPVEVVVRRNEVRLRALNGRGRLLLGPLAGLLDAPPPVGDEVRVAAAAAGAEFAEEDRTRQVGLFALLRRLVGGLAGPHDALLGLYGALGYDLIFQLEPMELVQPRAAMDRDVVLHLPDEICDLDLTRGQATRHRYEFRVGGTSTALFPAATPTRPFLPGVRPVQERDHPPGGYAETVAEAKLLFGSGDLFEAVPSQVFRRACRRTPGQLFRRLRASNPAPYAVLMNLGEGEYLIGASPEMFVRVEPDPDDGRLVVRTAPISGTAARGEDALADALRVRELLDSGKDEDELTMCTDVDRNDKSRVCVPGTIRVTARRQIETYSTLIHTVDHVEGVLRPEMDALDAFLAHLWAVTVTGAPKLAAVEFIEHHERSPRRWYGGAVGKIGFDGSLASILTLRTIEVRDGVATVRAGATLLHASDPAAEERETELKARALLAVLDPEPPARRTAAVQVRERPGAGRRVLLVDHRDSFVHTLAGYLRETGAAVETYRSGRHQRPLREAPPDLLVLSPGPGTPADFGTAATIADAERLGVPVLGVCLGLQALVEYAGGTLRTLAEPAHGCRSAVSRVGASTLLDGLPEVFHAGRYHSLYAVASEVPESLLVTATGEDGEVAMAVEDRRGRFAAVQFHPESIMTAEGRIGHRIVANAMATLSRRPA